MSENIPQWMSTALQGITAWIDYKRCFYSNSKILELPLVCAMSDIVAARLPNDMELRCEVPYKLFSKVKDSTRADMVICKKKTSNEDGLDPIFVIEVKRGDEACVLRKDLTRLARLKRENPSIRVFEIVIKEHEMPNNLVSESGVAQSIDELHGFNAKVMRVCKTIHTSRFNDNRKNLETANYACAIEIFG
ncbi:MAG: hypothetical protein MJY87_07650 [Fibrobacter sp.]|nr:hypothetical protein [Fibrobacter sp.]